MKDFGTWAALLLGAAGIAAGGWWAFRPGEMELRGDLREAVREARETGRARLVTCPVCRGAVSAAAKACPGCGEPVAGG